MLNHKTQLISFSGLPGVGKTTIAKLLASKLNITYLRIDTIEQAIKSSSVQKTEIDDSGYLVAYSVAKENLLNDTSIISDSVNPLMEIRDKWASIANEANVRIVEIEIICSDKKTHKTRVENRKSDIISHKLPSWAEITSLEYEMWTRSPIIIDTAKYSPDECVKAILKKLEQ